ncbi:MAG: hypothetical protein JF603_10605 [Acidobacteria bacterium]|nr:hypothetical protein [Acidobacteriota bacterium]
MTATQRLSEGQRVSRADIEAKLRSIQGDVQDAGKAGAQMAIIAGAAVAVGVVALAFWMGKRKGKKRTTVVEVRRV